MAPKRSFPAPLTVIMIVIILAAIATWFVPPGSYNRLSFEQDHFTLVSNNGNISLPATQHTLDSIHINITLEKFQHGDIRKPVAVPGSYHSEPRNGQGLLSVLQAPFKGMYDTVDIILFILIIGGFISIFYESGALEKGISRLAIKMKGKETSLIIIFTFLFALGGSSFGMAEETLAFYPLLVPIFLAAGYDLLMPVSVIFLGSNIGTMVAVTCPFSVIIASNAAGINWTVGTSGRIIMFIICVGITITYLLRYGKKIKRDPSASMVLKYDGPITPRFAAIDTSVNITMSKRDILVLILFAATFVMLVYGVVVLGWWLLEMSALFFASSIMLAIIIRMNEKIFVEKIIKGAESLLSVAFIVGLARGVTIILNDGHISDSILYQASHLVEGMSPGLFIISILVLFLVLSIFISSSSGMAVLTMPIIAPLGIMIGMGNQHIVNAYLFGMGIMNIITPTGLALPSLAMVNVSYKTWIKFMLPLMIILFIISAIYLLISVLFT
ncbi:YfcC family protein [Panacibacter ginsenosidivorans]|uniref:YfcC family protein n=1 Tax=Panacibacter ginsenosidivorans TaxID=1813871 RepID=A0A5B8VGE4_9BACT|nr:YfcC family protein [Panacibacter ginsenosidivorans]QEC69646.1 YfcC family protein [Panacibacter ginsenosidivorans]